jgi:hypothetical protein
MPAVSSSAIRETEYDELAHRLEITFVSGKSYIYEGVPRSVYERLLQPPSKGTFFNDHIKDKYSFALGERIDR